VSSATNWPSCISGWSANGSAHQTPAGESIDIIDPVLPEVVDASAPSTMYLRDLNMLVNLVRTVRHPGGLRAALQTDRFTVQTVTPLPPPTAFAVLEATPR